MLNNNFELLEELLAAEGGPRLAGPERSLENRPEDFHSSSSPPQSACTGEEDPAYKQSRVDSLLWAYRDVGYLYADLNPLGESYSEEFTSLSQVKEKSFHRLSLGEFGLAEEDLALEFFASGGIHRAMPLRDILADFRRIYCGYVGVEFLHIQNKEMREWVIARMEDPAQAAPFDARQRMIILEDLVHAEELERFLQRTFIGQKRFSLEGSEAVIPALHFLLDGATERGIGRIVMGTAHRGRLSILSLIVGKPLEELFYLFEENFTPGVFGGSDDVKYHIGYASTHAHEDGSSVEISLSPNASHLESVGPIVEGRARSVQDLLGEGGTKRVLPVIVHGDAAIAGQGVVAETFNMSQLRGYGTGGTVHVVINNQIGFTTPSRDAHSNLNPTDIAKMNPVPILHVNGDRPEDVVRVMRTALDFRQAFGSDVVVDIFCYRRLGHNEGDEPSFTHPFMYDLIQSHPSAAAIYGAHCVEAGLLSAEDLDGMRRDYVAVLEAALANERASPNGLAGKSPEAAAKGSGDASASPPSTPASVRTNIPEAQLSRIVEAISALPTGMHIHDKLKSIVRAKHRNYAEKGLLDWSLAEAAAFGSLLLDGVAVRLSGEDSARGTFSQRHLVWWEAGERTSTFYVPVDNIAPGQRKMAVYDSPLSEFGVLGFEYGYAAENPEALVMWEAQFGDFSNGGQVVVDNYIIAAEAKWGTADPLVLLLPHGYEGQGPEHSSAHLERFLMLCADHNIRVAYPSTPAQYFHLLRAQAKDKVKKPLIVMTPKSLLRHPAVLSPVKSFTEGGFSPVLDDPSLEGAAARKAIDSLILCTGKIYYELAQRKQETQRQDVAIVRIERLYPFPERELAKVLGAYPAAKKLTWAQEEPKNRGAWHFIRDSLETSFPDLAPVYAGRKASASPATGSHERHAKEQGEIIAGALGPRKGTRT